jgi:hypothetical protein
MCQNNHYKYNILTVTNKDFLKSFLTCSERKDFKNKNIAYEQSGKIQDNKTFPIHETGFYPFMHCLRSLHGYCAYGSG